MPFCKYCFNLEAREILLRPTVWEADRNKPHDGNSWGSKIRVEDLTKHHEGGLEELAHCALGPVSCELCETFLLAFLRPLSPRYRELSGMDKDNELRRVWSYLEKADCFGSHPLYVGPYHHAIPPVHPWQAGIGLWFANSRDDVWTQRRVCELIFTLKRHQMPEDEYPVADWVDRRDVARYAESAQCTGLVFDWLQDCINHHPFCDRICGKTPPHLPTRVIDVGDEVSPPRLVQSKSMSGHYVALSYCWGLLTPGQLILKKENIDEMQLGIPIERIPTCLRDAINLTRCLRIRYIWIDALCIIQDSEKDWVKEAKSMFSIYGNSQLVIFAANSSTSHESFLRVREWSPEVSIPWVRISQSQQQEDVSQHSVRNQVYLRIVDSYKESTDDTLSHLNSPTRPICFWASRGWTLQERLAGLRGITYTKGQMQWHCPSILRTESGKTIDYGSIRTHPDYDGTILHGFGDPSVEKWFNFLHTGGELTGQRHQEVIKFWYNLFCQKFKTRLFTYETDKLPAVAAAAKALEIRLRGKDKYFAGLWESDWGYGLMWKVEWYTIGSARSITEAAEFEPKFHNRVATPSWSWASTTFSSYPVPETLENFRILANMLVFPTCHSDDERFVPTTPMPLLFSGPTIQLSVDWMSPDQLTNVPRSAMLAKLEEILRSELHLDGQRYPSIIRRDLSEFFLKHKHHRGQQFLLIQIGAWTAAHKGTFIFCILVESVSEELSQYRRVAALRLCDEIFVDRNDKELFKYIQKEAWPERIICLI